MTIDLDGEYLSVAQAAAALRVNTSTIRRWIAQGELPAYRVGQRRVVLKRADVAGQVIAIARAGKRKGRQRTAERPSAPSLTPEQQRQAFAAVEAARRLQAELLAARDGRPFPPSWETLNDLRDERSGEGARP